MQQTISGDNRKVVDKLSIQTITNIQIGDQWKKRFKALKIQCDPVGTFSKQDESEIDEQLGPMRDEKCGMDDTRNIKSRTKNLK